MINGLLEILTTKRWAMQPEALDAYRHIIQANLNGHVALEAFEKKEPYKVAMGQVFQGSIVNPALAQMPGSHVEHTDDEPEVQSFVAILPVCGPITRNGDGCSYGSADLRDAVIEASDHEECKGIIFYINTPGGSVAAVPDFKYAIDYAHQHGKKVIAYVDGLCASCGMWLSALCDERYYMNKEDQVGCIGVLAAFYTEKDGSTNAYTNETYHELYATQSPDKNKWHRDAAEGDYKEIQAELDADCEKFHEAVKAACPNVKPEHLAGGIFNAEDIDGILMDGQRTLDEVIASMVNADSNDNKHNSAPANGNQTSSPSGRLGGASKQQINMNNYPLINAALGMEEGTLVVGEEGTHMDTTLLDKMEAHLAEQAQKVADAEAKATELADAQKALADAQASLKETEKQLAAAQNDKETADKALADAQAKFDTEKADAEKAHAKALEDAKAEADKALADAQAKAESDLGQLRTDLEGAKASLATAEQTIADRDAQIKALTEQPAQQQAQGASPANNGSEAHAETPKTDYPVWDGKESMTAYKARLAEWHKSHNC